jgi:hypothetical protein
MKIFLQIGAALARTYRALSRWGLALGIALLLIGIWAWLDVTLRMLPQPQPINPELQKKSGTPVVQSTLIARRTHTATP